MRLRLLVSRLRALFRGRAIDRDLQDEIESHLEEAIDDYLRQGLSPEDARHAALRSFGAVARAQEAHREVRSFAWLEDGQRDLRYAVKSLWRTPGFAAVSILTLALAIGAATAIFSVIDVALLRPVPYERPEEIVVVSVDNEGRVPSVADIEAWRAAGTVFSRIGMGRFTGFRPMIVNAGVPERVTVGTASEDLLEIFGITPILGRAFHADDRRVGAEPVVLVGHRFWQTRLKQAPDVIGRSLTVESRPATIVGVLPEGFYPETMVWRPHVTPAAMHGMRATGVPVYARIRPGLDLASASRELSRNLAVGTGGSAPAVWLTSLYESTTRGYGRTIAILSGAVVLIVLIACVNVAGLLLARGTTRQAELAVRKAIGASRGRIVRQLLAESLVLAVAGGLGGIVLAFLTLDVIVGLIPLRLPDNVTPAINGQVLGFTLTMAVVTSIVFGLAPAIKLSGASSVWAAAARLRQSAALSRRGGQALIAIEIALALILLTGAALMIQSFARIQAIDVGFEPDEMLTMELVPVNGDPLAHDAYYRALLENVRRIPGVTAAGGADRPPLDGSGSYTSATVNGRDTGVAVRHVMPGYFEAVGSRLRDGRFPTDADFTSRPSFAVMSESAAKAMFPNQVAVGQQFTLDKSLWTVIGIVGDALNRSPLPRDRESPDVYLALQPDESSAFGAGLAVVVRYPSNQIGQLAEQLRSAAHAVGPSVIVERVRSGRDWFGEQVTTPRQRTTMLSLLAGLGLVLTFVGIFGTTAYAVARRTREMAVRLALGANPGQMVGAIVRDAVAPAALGIPIGAIGALGVTQVIESFLFETKPTDPMIFAITATALVALVLAAAWVPARRIARVDPTLTLRAE